MCGYAYTESSAEGGLDAGGLRVEVSSFSAETCCSSNNPPSRRTFTQKSSGVASGVASGGVSPALGASASHSAFIASAVGAYRRFAPPPVSAAIQKLPTPLLWRPPPPPPRPPPPP